MTNWFNTSPVYCVSVTVMRTIWYNASTLKKNYFINLFVYLWIDADVWYIILGLNHIYLFVILIKLQLCYKLGWHLMVLITETKGRQLEPHKQNPLMTILCILPFLYRHKLLTSIFFHIPCNELSFLSLLNNSRRIHYWKCWFTRMGT